MTTRIRTKVLHPEIASNAVSFNVKKKIKRIRTQKRRTEHRIMENKIEKDYLRKIAVN